MAFKFTQHNYRGLTYCWEKFFNECDYEIVNLTYTHCRGYMCDPYNYILNKWTLTDFILNDKELFKELNKNSQEYPVRLLVQLKLIEFYIFGNNFLIRQCIMRETNNKFADAHECRSKIKKLNDFNLEWMKEHELCLKAYKTMENTLTTQQKFSLQQITQVLTTSSHVKLDKSLVYVPSTELPFGENDGWYHVFKSDDAFGSITHVSPL